jgi:cytochrome P450
MTWILWVLSNHPEVQQKCREEILSFFADDSDLTWEQLEALHYCNNVIKECLRSVIAVIHPSAILLIDF